MRKILGLLSFLLLHPPAWADTISARPPDLDRDLELRAVVFAGNRAVTASTLADALPIKVGARLPALVLEEQRIGPFTELAIVQPLSRLYLDRGYVDHQVDRDAVRFVVDDRGVSIHVRIVEGRRYAVRRFSIEGERRRASLTLGRQLGIVIGRTFSGTSVVQAMELLRATLRNQGHAAAEVAPRLRLDRRRRVVDVHLTVDPGAVYYVERIELRGNERVRDAILQSVLTFGEGDRFSQDALERTQRDLLAQGLFESVNVVVSGGTTDGQLVITVEVQEREGCPRIDAA